MWNSYRNLILPQYPGSLCLCLVGFYYYPDSLQTKKSALCAFKAMQRLEDKQLDIILLDCAGYYMSSLGEYIYVYSSGDG